MSWSLFLMAIRDENTIQILTKKFYNLLKKLPLIGFFLKKYKKILKIIFIKYVSSPRDFLFKKVNVDSPICCEIGVYEGIFSNRILLKCKPKKLLLIDPWEEIPSSKKAKYNKQNQELRYKKVKHYFRDELSNEKIEILRMRSEIAKNYIKNNFIDFLYIDGDHSYDAVLNDLKNYYPKVKNGGLIAGDDIRLVEVRKALEDFQIDEQDVKLKIKNDQFYFFKP